MQRTCQGQRLTKRRLEEEEAKVEETNAMKRPLANAGAKKRQRQTKAKASKAVL